jgi:pimeloyl-ACP methyl ester carboxylesterase
VLAVTGELDGEHLRRAAVERALAPICENLELASLAECGHYPIQEAPPRLTAIVQRFLRSA